MGGEIGGPCAHRLRTTCQLLVDHSTAGRGSLHVLDSPTPGAYAWPDGRIYVTRGLSDLVADEELAAAVAHELRHHPSTHRATPPSSVLGHASDTPTDEEARADAIGVSLLREEHVPPAAMRRMLEKLNTSPALPAGARQAIRSRIDRLSRQFGA
jgi:predicted Zn-dependent protease